MLRTKFKNVILRIFLCRLVLLGKKNTHSSVFNHCRPCMFISTLKHVRTKILKKKEREGGKYQNRKWSRGERKWNLKAGDEEEVRQQQQIDGVWD